MKSVDFNSTTSPTTELKPTAQFALPLTALSAATPSDLKTVDELFIALDARQWSDVGCVLLTGNGPSAKKMVAGRSVRVAINVFAAKMAINMKAPKKVKPIKPEWAAYIY